MRSTTRQFLAAILLTAAAGVALSQEASAPPPPPAPEVAAPVAALPQIPPVVAVAPVPDPNAPAVNPALTIDPSVLPAAQAVAQVPEPETVVVTTTAKRVTKKSATKPVAKPAVQASESLQSVPAPAAAGTDPSTFQGLTPPIASANTAPAESVAPAPAAAKAVTADSQPEQTIPQKKLGLGSWILGAVLILALASIAIRFLRKRLRTPTSIVDFTDIHPELTASVVRRT